VGLHKSLLEAHGIDHRIFHYYLGRGPVWSPRKEELIGKIIEVVRTEYPGLGNVIGELENYRNALKELAQKKQK